MYIPAFPTALQIHFMVITNVHGYYTIMHNTPLKTFENSQWKVINLILDDDEKYQPIVYLKSDQQASKSTKSTMSNNGDECITDGTNNLATHENQQVLNEPEVQPLDEPEVPTNVETPVPPQCNKVTQDLDALSIDLLDKYVTVIPETQLSQIHPNNNAESTSDTNINSTREESNSIEGSFLKVFIPLQPNWMMV